MYDAKTDMTRKMCGYGCDIHGKMCDNSVEVAGILWYDVFVIKARCFLCQDLQEK